MGLNKPDLKHQPPIPPEEYSSSWYAWNSSPHRPVDHQLYRKGDVATKRHWKYHYFNNKSVDWWLERTTHDKNIKAIVIPEAISHIVRNELITEDEAVNLTQMIDSSDSENFVIAMMVIIKYKQQIFKLKKNGRK